MALIRMLPALCCIVLAACVTPAHRAAVARDKPPAKPVPEMPAKRDPEPPVAPAEASPESPAAKAYARGLDEYAEGNFAEAATDLQVALSLGLAKRERIDAHKHLAFMHCMAGRKNACRKEFRKALKVAPGLELSPAEAGHPQWGPVFRQAKAEAKLAAARRVSTRRRKAA